MLRRSVKYFIVAFLNLVVLTILLVLWTDKLELLLNDGVRQMEFLKIVAFTIASLIAMRIAVSFFRKRHVIDIKSKIKIASFLTLLISSYLYIDYSGKLFKNRILNGPVRRQAAAKIQSLGGNGVEAHNLTIQEYNQISKFPKLPDQAIDIKYSFEYDGFLPDYYFQVTYKVPKKVKVDTLYFEQGDFTRSQTIDSSGDKLKVTYTESEQ